MGRNSQLHAGVIVGDVVGDVAVYVAFLVSPSNRSHSMRATRPRRPGWDIGGSGQAAEAGLAEGIVLSVGK